MSGIRRRKRSWFVAIVLLGVLAGIVSCPVSNSTTAGLSLTLINGGSAYSVTDGTRMSGSLAVPPSWKGLPVTAIGDDAFRECTALTSITIPGSVTSIGASAFKGCTGLASLTIPDSVVSIGDGAFYSCLGLASVMLSNSLTDISPEEFYGCTSLAGVAIPTTVTTIGDAAFYNCDGLTSLTIPNGVTTIGAYAFGSCLQLSSVSLLVVVPPTARSGIFNNSNLLTKIHVPLGSLAAYSSAPVWSGYSPILVPP